MRSFIQRKTTWETEPDNVETGVDLFYKTDNVLCIIHHIFMSPTFCLSILDKILNTIKLC